MEEIQQRLSIQNEMVRASEVNHDVIFVGVEKFCQSKFLICLVDVMKLPFNFSFQMKSSSKHIPEDDSSCETVVQSQQSDIREHEEAEDNSPSQVVEEKIQSINSEHYEEQEILLNQEKHIQVLPLCCHFMAFRDLTPYCENGCFLYLLFPV